MGGKGNEKGFKKSLAAIFIQPFKNVCFIFFGGRHLFPDWAEVAEFILKNEGLPFNFGFPIVLYTHFSLKYHILQQMKIGIKIPACQLGAVPFF